MVGLGAVRFSRLRFKFNKNILIASTLAAPCLPSLPPSHTWPTFISVSFLFLASTRMHIDTKVTFNKVSAFMASASETRPVDSRQTATAVVATSASTDAACRQKWSALKVHLVASCRLSIFDCRLFAWQHFGQPNLAIFAKSDAVSIRPVDRYFAFYFISASFFGNYCAAQCRLTAAPCTFHSTNHI